MLPNKQTLSKLVGCIYDAASEASLWERFLRELAQISRADSAALVMHQLGREVHTIAASWEFDPEASRLYQSHYGSLDLWAMRGRSKPAGFVSASQALCSTAEIVGSEIYNDFMVPYRIEHGIFGVIENSATRWASTSLFRSRSSPQFRESEGDILNFLVPHIRRAFTLHFQFSELKAQAVGFSAALNALPSGVIVLGAKGEILLMNRAAHAILMQNDGLLATAHGLHAACAAESVELERLIREVVSTAEGKGLAAGGGLSISRKKGSALYVLISSARDFQVDLAHPIRAIVFISDPEQKARPAQEILRAIFGLTPAECRVALLLGDGKTPREISHLLAVSANTVKSQVSTIYAKTGTSRQAQLVRLLMKLPEISPPENICGNQES